MSSAFRPCYCPLANAAASAFSLFSSSFTLAICRPASKMLRRATSHGAMQRNTYLDGNDLQLRHNFCEVSAIAENQTKFWQYFFEEEHENAFDCQTLHARAMPLLCCHLPLPPRWQHVAAAHVWHAFKTTGFRSNVMCFGFILSLF